MKKISCLVVFVFLSGCLGGISSPSHFYRLKAITENIQPISSQKMEIGVEEALIPQYLNRPQIVTMEKGSNELKISEFERWAEPLSDSFSRILADDISNYLPQSTVKYKMLASEDFTYNISVEVNKIDAVLGEKLELDVWWTIYKQGQMIYRKRSDKTSPLTNSYEDLAKQLSLLINDLAKEIAVNLAK